MRDKKDKRKHHESTIGKIIYGFLLFAPLLAIGFTCLYAVFNKNAYQSYGDNYVQNTQIITNSNQLTLNNEYYVVYKNVGGNQMYNDIIYYYSNISIDWTDYGASTSNTYIGFMINSYQNPNNRIRIYYYDTNNTLQNTDLYIWGSSLKEFTFTLSNYNDQLSNVGQTNADYILYKYFITTGKISDVFYYSIDKVEESNLFNWSKNTSIYTVLNNTSNTLGITNTFWPMLMAYWLLISIIYILYDIVLMMLVIFHRKVHCLQDSV